MAFATFFEQAQDSLREILESGVLSERLRTVFTELTEDEKLGALVEAEREIRAERAGETPREEDGGTIEDSPSDAAGKAAGGGVISSQETVSDEGGVSQRDGTPMTRPISWDIIQTIRTQLGTMAATEGMTELVEPFMELAREIEAVFPIQKTIEGILADPAQGGKIHAVVAQASITPELDMPVRVKLAQIAIELYAFGRMHAEVTKHTADPNLPDQARAMATAMATQSQLAPSICSRILVMAEEGNLTDGQRVAMRELASHPSLQNEASLKGPHEADKAPTATGKEAATKPKQKHKEQVKEQGMALKKDLRKDLRKEQAKDTPAAKGGRPGQHGKKK